MGLVPPQATLHSLATGAGHRPRGTACLGNHARPQPRRGRRSRAERTVGPEGLEWGLHDATLDAIHVDYAEMRLVVDVRVQYGERQDHERRARLVVDELLFLVVEPPALEDDGTMQTYNGRIAPIRGLLPSAVERLPKVPPEAYGESFFVSDWNAYFHFAARKPPRLEWIDPAPVAREDDEDGVLYAGDTIAIDDKGSS